MVVPFLNSAELLQKAQESKTYKDLVLQLQKDFGLANIYIDLEPTSNNTLIEANTLKAVLQEKIYFLIRERFSEYLNLLYIIDVPEREVKKITLVDTVDVAEQITFLILKREWQKVWLRANYD